MKKGIIGKKVGMTQIFDEAGKVIPVTVIQAGPCVVVQKKTVENDGYDAVQLGYEDAPARKLNKPQKGHLGKAGDILKKYLKEFQLDDAADKNLGDVITVESFEPGDKIDVTGVSKGKGYAGTIKRFNGSQRQRDPRRRPRAPSCRFHGRRHRPLPHHARKEDARSARKRAGHDPESRRGQD